MATLDQYPIPNSSVRGRILENEAVLVLPDQGQVKVLNQVGASIWTMANGARSARDIAAALCVEYEVSLTQAEADTLAFLNELEARGIIAWADRGSQVE